MSIEAGVAGMLILLLLVLMWLFLTWWLESGGEPKTNKNPDTRSNEVECNGYKDNGNYDIYSTRKLE